MDEGMRGTTVGDPFLEGPVELPVTYGVPGAQAFFIKVGFCLDAFLLPGFAHHGGLRKSP